MLNQEQRTAYERGKALYIKWFLSEDSTPNTLDTLYDAFEILCEYVDEVDDIDYRFVFANVVQAMLESGEFELSEDCIDTKNQIYLQTLKWFVNLDTASVAAFTTTFKMFLCYAFDTLATILLKGEELPQNDHVAWICYSHSKRLGYTTADNNILTYFEKNKEGKMVLKADIPRPE